MGQTLLYSAYLYSIHKYSVLKYSQWKGGGGDLEYVLHSRFVIFRFLAKLLQEPLSQKRTEVAEVCRETWSKNNKNDGVKKQPLT